MARLPGKANIFLHRLTGMTSVRGACGLGRPWLPLRGAVAPRSLRAPAPAGPRSKLSEAARATNVGGVFGAGENLLRHRRKVRREAGFGLTPWQTERPRLGRVVDRQLTRRAVQRFLGRKLSGRCRMEEINGLLSLPGLIGGERRACSAGCGAALPSRAP